MLKPKYVHGLNSEQAPQSLLHRLQHDRVLVDNPQSDPEDTWFGLQWTWDLG